MYLLMILTTKKNPQENADGHILIGVQRKRMSMLEYLWAPLARMALRP